MRGNQNRFLKARNFEHGMEYSDDDADTVDGDEIPDGNIIPNGEVELDEEGSDQSGETKVVEAGDDYMDQWAPNRDGGRGRRRMRGNQNRFLKPRLWGRRY